MSAEQALNSIVDDDFDFLEINRIILEGAGYRVVTATNPTEAQQRIDAEAPDLVITDLMMTSIDAGFAFAARLKGEPRTADVPIIISTSVSSALGLNFRPDSAEDLAKMNVDATSTNPSTRRRSSPRSATCSPPEADGGGVRTMNEDRVPYLQLVTTIREKCRRCYTCVRECPAKAIQIEDGQASVIQTRCIGCGNCVTVCSQNAKQVLSGIEATEALLDWDAPVAAIVAPSYPAEFTECSTPWGLVGALRDLGFAGVHEVSFGAHLVAEEYVRLLGEHDGRHTSPPPARRWSATCASTPTILDRLAPIVSPMLAIACFDKQYGPELKIVFVGPCIAKKGEARYEQFEGEVDAARPTWSSALSWPRAA